MTEERETATIVGQFAEALGCIEDALCWLGRVNEQYEGGGDYVDDDIRFCNPSMDFWLQAENAEGSLKDILRKLQGVENLVPKEGDV